MQYVFYNLKIVNSNIIINKTLIIESMKIVISFDSIRLREKIFQLPIFLKTSVSSFYFFKFNTAAFKNIYFPIVVFKVRLLRL